MGRRSSGVRRLAAAAGPVVLLVLHQAGPQRAHAAGFAILENSAAGLGIAFAGEAARAQDGSTVFFNPAGMAALERDQLNVVGHVLVPHAEYDDTGSTVVTGAPLRGDDGDGGETVLVPNLFAVYGATPRLKLGLGVNAPFGLATEWDDDFVGRYHALKSEIATVNIQPAASFALTDWLAVGAGVNVQYIDATLSNAIDFGTIGLLQLGPATAAALGLAPQEDDGSVEVEADDWGVGFNLGVLFAPGPDTRLGLAFRSGIAHELEGDADFTVPPDALPLTAGGRLFTDTGASAEVELPETVLFGAYHRFLDRWAVLAGIDWTNWSDIKDLRIEFEGPEFGPTQPDNITVHEWEDTFRYSLGITYDWSDDLILRFGTAYDETPVPDRTRTPRLPDGDRFWLAAGLGYRLTERFSIDLGYAHLFVEDGDIDLEDPVRGNLRGSTDNAVDIFSAQVNWLF